MRLSSLRTSERERMRELKARRTARNLQETTWRHLMKWDEKDKVEAETARFTAYNYFASERALREIDTSKEASGNRLDVTLLGEGGDFGTDIKEVVRAGWEEEAAGKKCKQLAWQGEDGAVGCGLAEAIELADVEQVDAEQGDPSWNLGIWGMKSILG